MSAAPAPARPADAELAARRYGTRPRSRRPFVALVVALAVVAVAGVSWVAWGMLQPRADAEVSSFRVQDDAEVALVLDVTRPIGSTAVCTVEALGAGFSQVGLLDVEVPPATTAFSQVDVAMATSEVATVADVRSCRLLDD
jgi:hypothetical protein